MIIVREETVRLIKLNRSDLKESFVSLSVAHKFGTFVVPGPGFRKRPRQRERNSIF